MSRPANSEISKKQLDLRALAFSSFGARRTSLNIENMILSFLWFMVFVSPNSHFTLLCQKRDLFTIPLVAVTVSPFVKTDQLNDCSGAVMDELNSEIIHAL